MRNRPSAEIIDTYNIEALGSIIGSGAFTIAIEPFYFIKNHSKLKNPILIISKDKFKKRIANALFKGFVEEVKIENLSDDYRYIFEELKEYNIEYFFMEKIQETYLNFKNIDRALTNIQRNYQNSPFDLNHFSVEIFINDIKDEYKHIFQKDIKKNKNDVLILNSIKRSLNKIKRLNVKDLCVLDIHSEQFGLLNGKIVCYDCLNFDESYWR